MAVVEVWIVRMLMGHGRVLMPMAMRLARRVEWTMHMLMMGVMHVAVFVLQQLVGMLMLVRLGQMQP